MSRKPHAPITHAQEARKSLGDFFAFAASHDAVVTARYAADAAEARDMVGLLRKWLQRYGEALRP